MNLSIQVLSVTVTSKTSKTGKSFQNAEVAYKDLGQGKVASKNITQYSDVFKTFADAQAGQFYDVVSEKKGDFWEWTSAARNLTGPTTAPQAVEAKGNTAPTQYKSTYETPEERAKKQVLIVKQSSLTAALEYLKVSSGKEFKYNKQDVVDTAQFFVDWVMFGGSKDPLPWNETPNDLPDVE